METWAVIYGPAEKPSVEFLKKCHDTMYLVNVVDNDYINGDLDRVFAEFIELHKDFIHNLQ